MKFGELKFGELRFGKKEKEP